MIPLILNWQQAFEAGVTACGGKGYHLAKLQRYGFPVPDGGVVVADVYRQVMQAAALTALSLRLASLQAEDLTEPVVQEQLAHMRQGITTAALPGQMFTELDPFLRQYHLAERVMAVRSSAVSEDGPSASFAGIHQSVLNVQGVDAIWGQMQRGFALREAGKSGMVASLWPTRHLVFEIGRRLVAGGHLERPEHAFYLSKADLLSLLCGGMAAVRVHWRTIVWPNAKPGSSVCPQT